MTRTAIDEKVIKLMIVGDSKKKKKKKCLHDIQTDRTSFVYNNTIVISANIIYSII